MALAHHHLTKSLPKKSQQSSGILVIRNSKGLHTRPSTELVRCANRFQARILLTYHGATVNAKSLLGILMLAAGKGAKITIEATGIDGEEAVAALLDLAENHFYTQF